MIPALISPGLTPICGWQWIEEHKHDLDNYHPTIELIRDGSKQTMTIKDLRALNKVIKAYSSSQ